MLHAWEVYGLEDAAKEHFKSHSVRHKGKNNKELFRRILEGKLLFISDIRGKDDPLFKSLLTKFQKLTTGRSLQNYLSYQGEKIQIFTEGNTDWMHLKAALNSLSVINLHYSNLNSMIEIVEYEHNYVIGDSKLKGLLEGHLISKSKKPIIAIFDSDNLQKIGEFAPVTARKYNKFEKSVYTFYLPKPSHRKTSKNCIEHYYKDSDLKLKNKDDRRLYLASEFDGVTGKHKEIAGIRCTLSQKKLSTTEGIIDNNVIDENENSLALSKKDFAQNIYDQTESHRTVNFDSFKMIFDIISSIINDIQREPT
ncbi:hypothetical protein [Salinimicrobium sp. WS361]|uniref:hypothetical protein n=1 Tax=Salinimicrobium sp. WS361 TaxID=3425123 RepID=UPI003D6F6450